MSEIALVSCIKTNRDKPATPKNLYTFDYFEEMRSYFERFTIWLDDDLKIGE